MTLATRVGRGISGDTIESMQRDFDGVLGRLLTGNNGNGARLAPYAVDVREDADRFYVEAELPGFKKEDVQITVENQVLTIAAERKSEQSAEGPGDGPKVEWLLNERRFTRFLRSFTLPPTVSEQEVHAKLEQGVLTVTLKKREESKPRKIAVQ